MNTLAQIASAKPDFLWQFLIVVTGLASLVATIISIFVAARGNKTCISPQPLQVEGVEKHQTVAACKLEQERMADQCTSIMAKVNQVELRVDENERYSKDRRQAIYEELRKVRVESVQGDKELRQEINNTLGSIFEELRKFTASTSALQADMITTNRRVENLENRPPTKT
jgi:DNA repair exonuclease SbcCD nuclease subunit